MNHSNSHPTIMSRAFLILIVFLIVNPCIMLCQCFMNHILIPREQWTGVRLNHKRQRYSNQQKLYYRNDQGDKREDSLSLSSEIEVFDARSIRTENTEDKDDDVIAGVNMNSTHSTRKNEIDAIEKIGNIGGDIGSSIVCEKQLDYVGAGTLGDIMSDPSEDDVNVKLNAGGVDTADAVCDELVCDDDNIIEEETRNQCMSVADVKSKKEMGIDDLGTHSNSISGPTKSGLVTSTGGTLTAQYGLKIPDMSPLDRIALTANGNLQRIFSSFYDAPVHVHVDKCVRREGSYNLDDSKRNEAIWDREVNISIFDEVFCKATSVITVHSDDCIKIVESGEVGIGQLFRYLDKLPTFTIVDAGRCENGGLWRRYTLGSKELTCDILEQFVPDAWEIQRKTLNY